MPFGDRTLQDIRKRMQDIGALVYSDRTPIRDVAIWETKECVSAKEAVAQKFKPCKVGRTWGGPWRTAWFRVRLKLPAALAGRNTVARIVTGGEAVAP